MAFNAANDAALAHRANLNIASAVVAKLGSGASDSLIGNVIHEVRASHPVAELASAGGMSAVLGAVETAIARNAETNRPFNDTDSRAAQLAAQSGVHGGHWHHDGGFSRYGLLLSNRGTREASSEESGSSGPIGAARSGGGSDPAGSAFWSTAKGMLLTRSYANDNDMNWAPADLMRMGRPALQALKESDLKGDGYKALHRPSGLNFDNRLIVNGAGFMKRNGCNYNEAARSADELYGLKDLMPEQRQRVRDAERRFLASKDRAGDEAAKDNQGRVGDDLMRDHPDNPHVKDAVEKWRKKHDNAKQQEHRAEYRAEAADKKATVKVDTAELKKKQEQTAVKDATTRSATADANKQTAENQQKASATSKGKLAAALD